MRGHERVVAVADDDAVFVVDLEQAVARPIRPIEALDAPGSWAAKSVVVDLLEHGFVGHLVTVVLVGWPGRPVARRCQHLDHLEAVRRRLGSDDLVDLASGVAGTADLDLHVVGRDDERRLRDPAGSRAWRFRDGDDDPWVASRRQPAVR